MSGVELAHGSVGQQVAGRSIELAAEIDHRARSHRLQQITQCYLGKRGLAKVSGGGVIECPQRLFDLRINSH